MAAADYRLCDICDSKTFYDASLPDDYVARIGDWAVLCRSCAETFKVLVVPREAVIDTTAAIEASTRFRAEHTVRFMAACEESRKKREAPIQEDGCVDNPRTAAEETREEVTDPTLLDTAEMPRSAIQKAEDILAFREKHAPNNPRFCTRDLLVDNGERGSAQKALTFSGDDLSALVMDFRRLQLLSQRLDNNADGAEDAGALAHNCTRWLPALVSLRQQQAEREEIAFKAGHIAGYRCGVHGPDDVFDDCVHALAHYRASQRPPTAPLVTGGDGCPDTRQADANREYHSEA